MPLVNTNQVPPGGWIYEQFDAQGKLFKKLKQFGTFTMFGTAVLNIRLGNALPSATLPEVQKDVADFTCNRLGNDPRFCVSGSGPVAIPQGAWHGSAAPGCNWCGGKKAT